MGVTITDSNTFHTIDTAVDIKRKLTIEWNAFGIMTPLAIKRTSF
jgi:hypothetical protein